MNYTAGRNEIAGHAPAKFLSPNVGVDIGLQQVRESSPRRNTPLSPSNKNFMHATCKLNSKTAAELPTIHLFPFVSCVHPFLSVTIPPVPVRQTTSLCPAERNFKIDSDFSTI